MKTRNIIAIMSATVLMSSCGLYNKYERPDVNTQGLVRDPISATDTLAVADTASFGNVAWRSVFTDPQLQTLIEKGLENNPDLLNAALNVKQVEAALLIAKLAFVPSITLTPQGTLSSFDGSKTSKSYSLPVTASWNVDLFGNLLATKRGAQKNLIAMKDYQLAVKSSVITNIANMYYTLLMLDRQMEILTEMTGLAKDSWDKMKLMELRGSRPHSTKSAEASYYSVLAQVEDMKRQIREVENALSLMIGEPAHAIARGKLSEQNLPTEFSTGVGIQLLNNRPDVHYAEMQLAQCFHNVQVARSRFYPSITISGTGAFTNNGGSINPGKWLLNAVGSLVQPVFMNGQLIAGLKVAKAQQEQAYNTWQNAVLKAGNEVSNALVAYNANSEKARLEEKQVAALRTAYENVKELYGKSNVTYLEVISAQSQLLNAELSKTADEFSKMQAVVSLYSALGGGKN